MDKLRQIRKVWEDIDPINIARNTRKLESKPKELWNQAVKYFEFVDQNPFYKQELITGGMAAGTAKDIRQNRPYTVQGCEIHMRIRPGSIAKFAKSNNEDLADVAATIKHIIDNDKLEGALSGIFVPTVVIRDLGLADKVETTETTITIRPKNIPEKPKLTES